MTTSHTPGRLKLSFGKHYWDYMINSAKGTPIAYFGHYKPMTTKEGKANARRLVAAWNACEGISTENLEDNQPIRELAEKYNAALAQRSELLNALKELLEEADAGIATCPLTRNKARAAIAKAEGERE